MIKLILHFWHYLKHEDYVLMLIQIRIIQTQDTNKLWTTWMRAQWSLVWFWAQVTACEDFRMFSTCTCGFLPGSWFFSHCPKIISMWIGYAKLLLAFEYAWCPETLLVPSVIKTGFRSIARWMNYLCLLNGLHFIFKNAKGFFGQPRRSSFYHPPWHRRKSYTSLHSFSKCIEQNERSNVCIFDFQTN